MSQQPPHHLSVIGPASGTGASANVNLDFASGSTANQFQFGAGDQSQFNQFAFDGLNYLPPSAQNTNPNSSMPYPPPPPQSTQPPHQIKIEGGYHQAPMRHGYHPYEAYHQHVPTYPIDTINNRRPGLNVHPDPKRPRTNFRHPSDEEEREAGLALAGLGLSTTPTQLPPVPESETQGQGSGPSKKARAKPAAKKNERGAEPVKGQNACKECRRLKAKCDKQIPCSTCVGRGCAGICPDGSMAKMQGKRLVISGTTELHERIARLEAALASSHSQLTSGTHPLLGPEHLDGGSSSLSPPHGVPTLSHSDSSPDTRPASLRIATPSNTMTSTDQAGSHPRMAVESLLLSDETTVPEGRKDAEWVGENAAPAFIIGTAMPPQPDAREKILQKLLELHIILPPREETRMRAKRYFESCQWFTSILRPAEFDNIYEPAVYEPSTANPLSPHKLACVLMVLTLESFLNVTSDEDDPAIAKYWEATQQCFDTRFGWAASVASIQTLCLATYFVTFGWRGARASNYYWLRQTTSAILQLGLHKDPHPSLSLVDQDLRRRVFWEAFTTDALLSINHGQKPAIYVDTVETLEPTDASEIQNTKYRYMREVKLSVLDIGTRPDSAPASQEQLQATLANLKRFEPSIFPHAHCPVLSGQPMPELTNDPSRLDIWQIHLSMSSMCHYKAYMFLFRPSLRRLIARIRSTYPESIVLDDNERQVVTATFDACRGITLISKYMTRTHPRLAIRLWSTWVQTFSAAVSMAALAIWCGTYMDPNFIPSAYQELCDACDLISENRSHRSSNVETLLPILQSIVADRYPYLVSRAGPPHIQPDKEDMLFALLGGRIENSNIPIPQPQTAVVPTTNQGANRSQPQPHPQQYNENNQFQAPPQHDPGHVQFWQTQPNVNVAFGQPDGTTFDEFDPANISAMELWNRFQSFYEPTPVSWGAGLGAETSQGGMNGMYDGTFGVGMQ